MLKQYLTKKFSFSSSHRLGNPSLSDEENEQLFGPCQNIHGHNYRLEVTVSGELDERHGFFCNVVELERIIRELVVDRWDHRHLNDLEELHNTVCTMEGMAAVIWRLLHDPLRKEGMQLFEIVFAETDDHWVRIRDE